MILHVKFLVERNPLCVNPSLQKTSMYTYKRDLNMPHKRHLNTHIQKTPCTRKKDLNIHTQKRPQ